MGGVIAFEIGNVGPYLGRRYSIGGRAGPVELPAAIKPGQPAAIIANKTLIRTLAVPGARAAVQKQVSWSDGGLPPSSICLRPLFKGLAATIGVLTWNYCHRSLFLCLIFKIAAPKWRTAAAVSRPV